MQNRGYRHFWRILGFFVLLAIVWFFYSGESARSIIDLATVNSNLLIDYLAYAGVAATLLNVVLVGGFTLILMQKTQVPLTGLSYAGLFTTMGFCFFGKNYLNIIPVFLGIYAYTKFYKVPFRQYLIAACFATCLAPITTMFTDLGFWGYILGGSLAFLVGLIIIPIAESTIRFQNGFDLYNYGFAAGIIAIIMVQVLKLFEFEFVSNDIINTSMDVHYLLLFLSLSVCIYLLVIGFLKTDGNKDVNIKQYKKLLKTSGQVVSDYPQMFGEGITFINMGLVGLEMLAVALLLGLPLNGPTVGAIFTGIGFGAFGKTPRNITPVMFGCYLMLVLSGSEMTAGALISVLFVTGLAPIAGKHGTIVGMLAGMLHFALVRASGAWQGGVNLYNNGFSAGFVAATIHAIMIKIEERDDE